MAGVMEFKMPMHSVDIELSRPDRFCVKDVVEVPDEPAASLEDVVQELGEELLQEPFSWTAVLRNDVFDKLYSFTKFWKDVQPRTRASLTQILKSVFENLTTTIKSGRSAGVADQATSPSSHAHAGGAEDMASDCDSVASEGEDEEALSRSMTAQRNAFKMVCFLLAEITTAASAGEAEASKNESATPRARRGAASSDASASKTFERDVTNTIKILNSAVAADFGAMWALGVAEEEFVGLFSKTALKTIECVTSMRHKTIRAGIVKLLCEALFRFPALVTSSTISIVHMLQAHAHTSPIIAEVVAALGSRHNDTRLVSELLREIGEINTTDSKDSAGIRNVAQFLVETSERVPEVVLANLSSFLPHLDGEAYPLRSAVIASLGNIVATVFHPDVLHQQQQQSGEAGAPAPGEHGAVAALEAQMSSTAGGAPDDKSADGTSASGHSGRRSSSSRGKVASRRSSRRSKGPDDEEEDYGSDDEAADMSGSRTKSTRSSGRRGTRGSRRPPSAGEEEKKGEDEFAISESEDDEDGDGETGSESESNAESCDENDEVTSMAASRCAGSSSPSGTETRDALLTVICERTRDINAFTRSATLRTFVVLASKEALPVDRYHTITALAAERLHDKAAAVRKTAVQLLNVLLEKNPFSDNLSPEKFREQFDASDLWLRSHPIYGAGASALSAIDEADEEAEDEEEAEDDADVEEIDNPSSVSRVEATDLCAEEAAQPSVALLSEEHLHHAQMRTFCAAALQFSNQITETIPAMCLLMGSKNATDVVEAIRFVCRAGTFSIPNTKTGMLKMLTLVWSGDQTIRTEVLKTFKGLYLCQPGPRGTEVARPADQAARSLVSVTVGSSIAVTTSMEEIMVHLTKEGAVLPAVVCELWALVAAPKPVDDGTLPSAAGGEHSEPHPTATEVQCWEAARRGALSVLSMLAAADSSLVLSEEGKVALLAVLRESYDYRLARAACSILLAIDDSSRASLCDFTSECVDAVIPIIRGDWATGVAEDGHSFYFGAAQEGIALVFATSAHPDVLCQEVITDMSAAIFGDDTAADGAISPAQLHDASRDALAQLFFVVGHVAMKVLVFAEATAAAAAKARTEQANASSAKPARTASKKRSKRPARGRGRRASAPADSDSDESGEEEEKDALEEELGIAAAAAAAEAQALQDMADNHAVCRHLISRFGSAASIVALNSGDAFYKYSPETSNAVLQSAVLAMSKFMCISREYCKKQLQTLFRILRSSPFGGIRGMIAIALADLAVRFPNIIEPHTSELYARLRDKNVGVRKNTLMVLTHLILNDMVKVKGQVAEIAVCLEDPEPRIRDLTRLFFHELSKRGNNPIYNLLPDTLGCLSNHSSLNETSFRSIMKFLIGFITKDKHTESLVEKLCHRFNSTEDPLQWRELAFCLGQLQFSDKAARKLADGFRHYKHTITDDKTFEGLKALVPKARKAAKGDTKDVVVDWEKKLSDAHGDAPDAAVESMLSPALKRRGGPGAGRAAGDEDADTVAVDETCDASFVDRSIDLGV